MTGSVALWPVQVAMYTILTGDATLQTLLGVAGRIVDQPATDQPFPYVIAGDQMEEDRDTLDASIRRIVTTVTVYSRYAGTAEALSVLDRICALLHRVTLTVTGWKHIQTLYKTAAIARNEDGVTRVGVIKFEVTVQQ